MSDRHCPECDIATSETVCAQCGGVTLQPTEFAGGAPHEGNVFAGKYEIDRRIGSGGMGVVYRAFHKKTERWVALKILHRRMATDISAVQRFHREMRAATRIEHPNTVRVYDFGHTADGDLFIAMELLEGQTLLQLVNRDGGLDSPRIIRIGIQIAKALGAAHQKGVVHRDLKPENVFLLSVYGEQEYVKLLDFGVARFSDGRPEDSGPSLTTTGQVVGTPFYMSPEQSLGQVVDHRSDIYSLGVVLYRLASGQVPFRDTTPMMVLYKHVHTAPEPPSVHRPGEIDPALESIILRMLEKSPEARPQSSAEVLTLLEGCLSGEMPTMTAKRTERTAFLPGIGHKRQRGVWAAGAIVALVVAGAAWWLLRDSSPATTDAASAGARAVIESAGPPGQGPGELGEAGEAGEAGESAATVAATGPNAEPDRPAETPTEASREIRIDSEPTGATVYRDDTILGTTPFDQTLTGLEPCTLRMELDGFVPRTISIDPRTKGDVSVQLQPVPPPAEVVKAPAPPESATAGASDGEEGGAPPEGADPAEGGVDGAQAETVKPTPRPRPRPRPTRPTPARADSETTAAGQAAPAAEPDTGGGFRRWGVDDDKAGHNDKAKDDKRWD